MDKKFYSVVLTSALSQPPPPSTSPSASPPPPPHPQPAPPPLHLALSQPLPPPPCTLLLGLYGFWAKGSNIWWLKCCHPHGVEGDVGSQLCPCCHVVCQCTQTFPDVVKMDMADALTLCVHLKNRLVVQINPIDKLCWSKWGFLPIVMFSLVYTVGLCYVTNQATSIDCDLSEVVCFFNSIL